MPDTSSDSISRSFHNSPLALVSPDKQQNNNDNSHNTHSRLNSDLSTNSAQSDKEPFAYEYYLTTKDTTVEDPFPYQHYLTQNAMPPKKQTPASAPKRILFRKPRIPWPLWSFGRTAKKTYQQSQKTKQPEQAQQPGVKETTETFPEYEEPDMAEYLANEANEAARWKHLEREEITEEEAGAVIDAALERIFPTTQDAFTLNDSKYQPIAASEEEEEDLIDLDESAIIGDKSIIAVGSETYFIPALQSATADFAYAPEHPLRSGPADEGKMDGCFGNTRIIVRKMGYEGLL